MQKCSLLAVGFLWLVGCVSSPSSITKTQSQTPTAIPVVTTTPITLIPSVIATGTPIFTLTSVPAATIPPLPPTPTLQALFGRTLRVSVASDGAPANATSEAPALSTDGRYVAFVSFASNLVAGDTHQCVSPLSGQTRSCADIFVHDRQIGMTKRVSVSSAGGQSDADNGIVTEAGSHVSISANGRWIAFHSFATNLVTGTVNTQTQIFVHDQLTGQTTRISATHDGQPGNGASLWPTISGDGRYVAFISEAYNLAPNDKQGQCLLKQCSEIFVYDRQTGQTELVSLSSDGVRGNMRSGYWYAPSLSTEGRYVAFWSEASNLVANDTNQVADIFVRDRQTGQTERISVASNGAQANGESFCMSLSGDGRYVAFVSKASNLVDNDTNRMDDVFVHDRQSKTTSRISVASDGAQANENSSCSSISVGGRFVVFASAASNLVSNDTNSLSDIFLYDRQTSRIERVSIAGDGAQANGVSTSPSVSTDGRVVAFSSLASNLAPSDTNQRWDIFVHERAMEP